MGTVTGCDFGAGPRSALATSSSPGASTQRSSAPIGRKSCGCHLDPYGHPGPLPDLAAARPYPRQNGLAAALRELGRLEARCSPSTGWGMRNCAVRPAANSTKARHATAWLGLL